MSDSRMPLTPEGVLGLVRELADEDAFLCDFAGALALNAPNLDRVILFDRRLKDDPNVPQWEERRHRPDSEDVFGHPDGKRIRAWTCPYCDGTILAPDSLSVHIERAHPQHGIEPG